MTSGRGRSFTDNRTPIGREAALEAGSSEAIVQSVRLRTNIDRVTVRFASPEDTPDLRRLAQLDTAPVPSGPTLVAEVDGVLTAAVPIGGGRAVADPFLPTEGVVRLLRFRAAQLAEAKG
jgi:hypothetical protein